MEQGVRILIIGESPLVEGVIIGLEHDPQITLQQVHMDNDDTSSIVTEYKPNAIIYQLGCPGIEEILSLMHLLPGVRLVGLDIACDQVLVIDSWLLDSPTMSELLQLIKAPAGAYVSYGCPEQFAGRMERSAMEVDVLGLER